jgi:hypothetical protein
MEGCIWGISRMWRWRLGWRNFAPPTLRKLPTTYCHHTKNLNPKITKSSGHCFEQAIMQKTKTFHVVKPKMNIAKAGFTLVFM